MEGEQTLNNISLKAQWLAHAVGTWPALCAAHSKICLKEVSCLCTWPTYMAEGCYILYSWLFNQVSIEISLAAGVLQHTNNSPCICSHHSFIKFRDLSRLLVIPFNLPKIGGESEEDCRNFQALGNLKKKASSCIGWAISLGKKFEEGGIAEINGVMLSMIHPQLKGLDPRFITGYSILLYFAKEVSAVHILRGVPRNGFGGPFYD